jgi:hypothetical protein
MALPIMGIVSHNLFCLIKGQIIIKIKTENGEHIMPFFTTG